MSSGSPDSTLRSQAIRTMAWEWVKKTHPKIAEKMRQEAERVYPKKGTRQSNIHSEFVNKLSAENR